MEENTRVKTYGIRIGIFALAAQHGIYLLAHFLSQMIGFAPILPKLAADDLFPIVPVFIVPYIWSYLFWAMGPMAVSRCKVSHFKDFMAAWLLSCLVGAVILMLMPTYMNRVEEGLYSVEGSGFFVRLMQFWYSLDGGELAYNLFPSFHCINSTVCCLGVLGRKEIPKWYRVYSLITTVLIYLSTLYVKQHFLPDVFGGIAIAAVCYALTVRFHWGRMFDGIVARRKQ